MSEAVVQRCYRFRKIHRKTPVSESLFNEVEFFSVFHDRVFITAEPQQVHVTELLNFNNVI